MSDHETFDGLVQRLEDEFGFSQSRTSQLLGYAGRNGVRDLGNVRAGKSMEHTLESAIAKLREELEQLAAEKAEWSSEAGSTGASAAAAENGSRDGLLHSENDVGRVCRPARNR